MSGSEGGGGSDEEEASVLGKKEHWDDNYAKELKNFRESGGRDVGDVWFGDDVLQTAVNFTVSLAAAVAAGTPYDPEASGPCPPLGAAVECVPTRKLSAFRPRRPLGSFPPRWGIRALALKGRSLFHQGPPPLPSLPVPRFDYGPYISLIPQATSLSPSCATRSWRLLDIGCGNGTMLAELWDRVRKGWDFPREGWGV